MFSKYRKYIVAGILMGCFFMFSMIPIKVKKGVFHSQEELNYFLANADADLFSPPLDSNLIFPTANNCNGCHGFDPQMNGSVTSEGEDVNVHDDWQTSMMANSAKDPFWRAKVSHEILVNPSHSLDLQTKCTSCHAPQGHFTAILRGAEHYTIAEMAGDTTAMDGVSCGACHMKSADNLDNLFSGDANYDTTRVIYGPYTLPFAAPMTDFVGFKPQFSEHINDAAICASCHTLLTNSVDLQGQLTGEKFVEQATYHEWVNSAYDDEGDSPLTCQGCHMPRLEDNIVISANYLFLQPRSPYALHDLVGSNTTMIKLLKENKETLNIEASDADFDETLQKTLTMLQQNSLNSELELKEIESDTAFFDLTLTNKAGHKFPSGYPSRRAYVEFILTAENGDTLFQSGVMDELYEVAGQTDATEPHFDVISTEDQVQIYEFVIGDVDGNFTTVLERAHIALKDNRLPPVGFSKTHSAYDTTRIYGAALLDPNFNIEDSVEGSGADIIHYNIPLNGYAGLVNVSAKVYYQALPPKWLNPMFLESTPEIDSFRTMYENADLSPVLITEKSIEDILVESSGLANILDEPQITIFPNPTMNGRITISSEKNDEIVSIKIYNSIGQLMEVFTDKLAQKTVNIRLPGTKQLYFLEVETSQGRSLHKVLQN